MNTEKGSSVLVFGDKVLNAWTRFFRAQLFGNHSVERILATRSLCNLTYSFSYRCIDDAATVLNVLAGHDVMDSTSVPDQYQPITLPDEVDVSNLHIGTNSTILSRCGKASKLDVTVSVAVVLKMKLSYGNRSFCI